MKNFDLFLWMLLLLWALLLFGGFALGRDLARAERIPRWARLGSSLALVMLAWYGYLLADTQPAERYAVMIAVGMSLGFAGDLFMARVLPAPNRVLAGMGAFGLGHIAYIAAITGYAPVGWAALLAWFILGAVLYYAVVLRDGQRTTLSLAAFPYALLLAGTAGVATGLAIQQPIFTGLAIGAALFLISDLLIAAELFNGTRLPLHNDIVWLTYGPGQMLIVVSVWGVL
jgi:hypothetical protein